MIKFMLGIAIICFTTFCGYFFAQKYRRRKDFFRQLCEFNERFLSEITYYRRPLPDFAASYEYKGDFHNLLTNYFQIAKEQQGIRLSFSQGMLDNVGLTFLRKEEKSIVEDYFLMLGKGDSASQKMYFTATKENLKKICAQSELDCKKYGDLYIKLGFLFGLLLLILMM